MQTRCQNGFIPVFYLFCFYFRLYVYEADLGTKYL